MDTCTLTDENWCKNWQGNGITYPTILDDGNPDGGTMFKYQKFTERQPFDMDNTR